MFDFKEMEKAYYELVKQAQQIQSIWVNAFVSSLDNFKK